MKRIQHLFCIPVVCMSIGILNTHPIIQFIKDQTTSYPAMQVQDVYKLLYQGEFGTKHIIENPADAKAYLYHELNQVPADTTEPLWEYISPDSAMVRINLRPFKAKNLDPENLWKAITETAELVTGDTARFKENWQIFQQAIEKGILSFSSMEVDEFWHQMEMENFPPVHHSGKYHDAYQPAYRVLRADKLPEMIK